ncbi:hypothetical protein BJ165DRAFT_1435883 [Panaeolus papilionaceus]|nr:hypothetical protein BJ165DRAFT_1435883 [Panaeolus papilionaceus]
MNLLTVTKGEISPMSLDTRTQAKIDDLLVQIRNLDSFISAARELRFLVLSTLSESKYHPANNKIIEAFETARSTLQAASIGLFEWAGCPPRRQCHKAAYLEALQALHARKDSISPELKRRLHILLMPLTSNFKFVQSRGAGEGVSGNLDKVSTETRQRQPEEMNFPSLDMETSSMPPPDTSRVRGTHLQSSHLHRSRSTHRIIWYAEDLENNRHSRRRRGGRSESPAGRRDSGASSSSNDYLYDDQENQPPAPEPLVYRAPRAFGKFGIYCTGKSSMHQKSSHRSNRSDRVIRTSSVRLS